jgi:hypothetical protein
MAWYRNDKEVVAAALRRGERPDLATTMASGPSDELVVLHEELGIFAIVERLEVQRKQANPYLQMSGTEIASFSLDDVTQNTLFL